MRTNSAVGLVANEIKGELKQSLAMLLLLWIASVGGDGQLANLCNVVLMI